jgi:hypothetical protein
MVYTWGDIYCKQLQSGSDFANLKPTYSIWLMGKNAIKDDDNYVHAYKLRDEAGKLLTDHGGIWLLELEKFSAAHVENEQERWLQFFKTGNSLNDDHELPDWMNTQEMRQAMSTLRQFSEKDKNYFAYQARQNYLRQQMSVYGELDAVKVREQEVLAREQQVIAERGEDDEPELSSDEDEPEQSDDESVLPPVNSLLQVDVESGKGRNKTTETFFCTVKEYEADGAVILTTQDGETMNIFLDDYFWKRVYECVQCLHYGVTKLKCDACGLERTSTLAI